MNRTILVPISFALLSITAASCQRSTEAQETQANAPSNEVWVTPKQLKEAAITTSVVGEQLVGNTLSTTGKIAFSDIRVAHVFSPVTGRVSNVLVALGQTVRRGEALAVIQSPDMGSAVSDVAKAEADLAAAQRDYERQKELYDAHAAAERDYEAAQDNYLKAKAERDRAVAKSRLLLSGGAGDNGVNTQQYVLRAPIDGEVVARSISLGVEVQGQYSGGTSPELFTIGNLDRVWAMADVFEVDLPRVRVGSPAEISVVAFPGKVFKGSVDWISGTLDPQTRTAKVRVTIDNRDHLLLPEMYAAVSIQTDSQRKLAVPRSAVVRLGDEMVVFVDKGAAPTGGERFERRNVAVDEAQAAEYIPVISGVAPGERVVSSGAVILSGGAA